MNASATSGRKPPEFPETSPGGYLGRGVKPPPAADPALPPAAALSAFASALDRLEEAIDEETAMLAAHRPADLAGFNQRKSRSLLELTRLSRTLPSSPDPAIKERLARLRDKLARNQAVLGLHLSAVREIGTLLVNAFGEAESDGTYAAPAVHREALR